MFNAYITMKPGTLGSLFGYIYPTDYTRVISNYAGDPEEVTNTGLSLAAANASELAHTAIIDPYDFNSPHSLFPKHNLAPAYTTYAGVALLLVAAAGGALALLRRHSQRLNSLPLSEVHPLVQDPNAPRGIKLFASSKELIEFLGKNLTREDDDFIDAKGMRVAELEEMIAADGSRGTNVIISKTEEIDYEVRPRGFWRWQPERCTHIVQYSFIEGRLAQVTVEKHTDMTNYETDRRTLDKTLWTYTPPEAPKIKEMIKTKALAAYVEVAQDDPLLKDILLPELQTMLVKAALQWDSLTRDEKVKRARDLGLQETLLFLSRDEIKVLPQLFVEQAKAQLAKQQAQA